MRMNIGAETKEKAQRKELMIDKKKRRMISTMIYRYF